jgi:hypothetical protein
LKNDATSYNVLEKERRRIMKKPKALAMLLSVFLILGVIPPMLQVAHAQGDAAIYKISVDAQQHYDYGLGYPVTYVFEIPSKVDSGLKAYTRYSVGDSWSQLTEKTSSDFFNGIEYVRFDYVADRAYVSAAFSEGSDDIYVRLTAHDDSLIESSYLGISDYYDNRKAVVTATDDDWDGYYTDQVNAAIDAYQARGIWFTGGLTTQGYPYEPYPIPPDWDNAQSQINQGYVEVASHSRTHAELPYPDYDSEIGGSKTDIVGNLVLPSTYTVSGAEYVWAWFEPWGTSDATVRQTLSEYKYLVSRS